jgi:hypothetical protein
MQPLCLLSHRSYFLAMILREKPAAKVQMTLVRLTAFAGPQTVARHLAGGPEIGGLGLRREHIFRKEGYAVIAVSRGTSFLFRYLLPTVATLREAACTTSVMLPPCPHSM